MSSSVKVVRHERATEIVFVRHAAGNALDAAMVEELHAVLDAFPVEVCDTLIFRGDGKGFCAGLDLTNIEAETDGSLLWRLVRIEMLLQRVANAPQETIALAHGFLYGAGADLFVACNRRIAAPATRVSFPGVRFGVSLGTARLARRVGTGTARRILASTRSLVIDTLIGCGLADELADPETWPEFVRQLNSQPSALDPSVARLVAARLASRTDDEDLAALVRSACRVGLKDRVMAHASGVRARRRDRSGDGSPDNRPDVK